MSVSYECGGHGVVGDRYEYRVSYFDIIEKLTKV